MTTGKTTRTVSPSARYLLYALGEITLVVIGILIALQINNWNEARKNTQEETQILLSLKEDLLKNKENLLWTIDMERTTIWQKELLIGIFEAYHISAQKEDFITEQIDSLSLYLNHGAVAFFREELVTGTFDALIGAGKVGLIRNQRLSRSMAEYSTEIKSGFEDHDSQINLQNILFEKISPYIRPLWPWTKNSYSTFYIEESTKRKAAADFLRDTSIEGILLRKVFGERLRIKRQRKLLNDTNALLDLVEEELGT